MYTSIFGMKRVMQRRILIKYFRNCAIFNCFRGLKPRNDGFVKVREIDLTMLMPSFIMFIWYFVLVFDFNK